MSLRKVIAKLKSNKNFLVTSHTNPEGDALGSELAFAGLLRKMGKGVCVVNEDRTPEEYLFLPQAQNIMVFNKKTKGINYDCLAVLDCSDLRRCKQVAWSNVENKPIINIDHHISNENFGQVNWVEPRASSCSELIYKLYKALRIPFDQESATSLYVGIMTDTGSFRYSNTCAFTHKIAAELLRYGIDVPRVYYNIYGNIPLKDIRFLTRILPEMKIEAAGRVAWFQVPRNIFQKVRPSFDLTDHILSFARAIKGVQVVALFRENLGTDDQVRVNLRSQGQVDVNKVAAFFGGGGHKTASGATVTGAIDTVRKKVLAKIKESLK